MINFYCCSKKNTGIAAGLFTLIQALIYCSLAVLSLLIYTCKIYSSETPSLAYKVYLVYLYRADRFTKMPMHKYDSVSVRFVCILIFSFFGGECDPVTIDVETDNGTLAIAWPEHGTNWTHRTEVWVIVYLVLSSLWVIAALLLLIATITNVGGTRGLKLRLPWMILTSIFLISDIVATLFYSIDISNSSNLNVLLHCVGAISLEDTISLATATSALFGDLTMLPSVILTFIFSRGIIIWILNLVLLMYVAQDARTRESTPVAVEPRKPYQEYLKKLSTIGPIPDVQWDPYQRKRSELPIMKPLTVPSPPNERKRKQSDYQQYLFYAKHLPQDNYLDEIQSEPPTPAPMVPTITALHRQAAISAPEVNEPTSSHRLDRDEGVTRKSSPETDPDYPTLPEPDYAQSSSRN